MAVGAVVVAIAIWAVILLAVRGEDGRVSTPTLLRGTIVTPDTVIADGWILVRDGRIRSASATKPAAPDAIELDTGGMIFPGLIDLHNHVSYNVFPRWDPPHAFANRYEWRADPEHMRLVNDPYDQLIKAGFFCDMNTYGELRALLGGTTAILTTAPEGCIAGLVRNLDFHSGFYGPFESDRQHIRNAIEARPATNPATLTSIRSFLQDSRSEAFLVHLAEGADPLSLEEFSFVQTQGLLTAKTVIIHGVALGPADFRVMHAMGASLVWSPRSNLMLYGQTADIAAACDAGVPIALGPDWAITGSSNLLDELHYAAQWNADHLAGRLTEEQLVAMVTTIPAQLAGIDDEVGAIRAGLQADLLVIVGDRQSPYRALIQAQASDVQLVLIGGQPLLGTPDLMRSYWDRGELSEFMVDDKPKAIKLPHSAASLGDLRSRLHTALGAHGTELAPLTESR
jgi:cytosine/adenosine deaminase-related metal-dependent hydrolase